MNREKRNFNFETKDDLNIGSFTSAKSQVWDGKIYFVEIFDAVISAS